MKINELDLRNLIRNEVAKLLEQSSFKRMQDTFVNPPPPKTYKSPPEGYGRFVRDEHADDPARDQTVVILWRIRGKSELGSGGIYREKDPSYRGVVRELVNAATKKFHDINVKSASFGPDVGLAEVYIETPKKMSQDFLKFAKQFDTNNVLEIDKFAEYTPAKKVKNENYESDLRNLIRNEVSKLLKEQGSIQVGDNHLRSSDAKRGKLTRWKVVPNKSKFPDADRAIWGFLEKAEKESLIKRGGADNSGNYLFLQATEDPEFLDFLEKFGKNEKFQVIKSEDQY